MPVCSSLPNSEYSNLLTVEVFSNKSFSGETSSKFKNSYLTTFSHDKTDILTAFLSELY